MMMTGCASASRVHPWAELLASRSTRPSDAGLWDIIKENADYPYYLIRDRFHSAEPFAEVGGNGAKTIFMELDRTKGVEFLW